MLNLSMDTLVVAVATILGPVVAVVLALFVQSRMDERHRQWQEQFSRSLEEGQRRFEMTRAEAMGKYQDAWNVATRDRSDRVAEHLGRIATSFEGIRKQGNS